MNHLKKKNNKKYQIASFGVDDVKLYDLSNILFSNISFLLIAIKNKNPKEINMFCKFSISKDL